MFDAIGDKIASIFNNLMRELYELFVLLKISTSNRF